MSESFAVPPSDERQVTSNALFLGRREIVIVHHGQAVLHLEGTIDCFIQSVYNVPTLTETYKYAAYDGLGNLAGHKLREG